MDAQIVVGALVRLRGDKITMHVRRVADGQATCSWNEYSAGSPAGFPALQEEAGFTIHQRRAAP